MPARLARIASVLFLGLLAPTGSDPYAVAARSQSVAITAVAPEDVSQWEDTVAWMARTGELRLRQVRDDALLPDRAHDRFDQYYKGVRVFGGDVARQRRGQVTMSVFGQLYRDINLNTTPGLSAEKAKEIVERITGVEIGFNRVPELVVLPLQGDSYSLAYRVRTMTSDDLTVYFIDAHDGHVVDQYSDLQRQSAVGLGAGVFGDQKKVSARSVSGSYIADDLLRPPEIITYDMRGNTDRTLLFLNSVIDLVMSDVATGSSNNTWSDGPDVDAHVYAGYTYDYYYKRFGRLGLDNRNIRMTVLTHPVRRSDLLSSRNDIVGLFFLNAFYAGDGIVCYGEGLPPGFVLSRSGQTVDYYSAGLDVVAHELSHGVTEFTSNLIYRDQSGALNEAFSDFMGISVKFYFQPPGNGLMQANYQLGSDVYRPGGLRSLSNPRMFGDPDHFSQRLVFDGPCVAANDNCGLHTNCTIIDHAFYLAIEGGTNLTSGLSVQGVGAANREQIEKAFYRGFTAFLTANATFSAARVATIQAARELYGAGSAAERAVTQAWIAVGVP